ncbi:MAG: type II secretion system F family protein [Granulosicoccaceae bacterium]
MVIIVSVLAFLAVVLLLEGFYLLWRALHVEGSQKISRRLRALSAGGSHGKEVFDLLRHRELSSVPLLNRWLSTIPRAHAIDRALEQAGIHLTVTRFVGIQLFLALVIAIALSFLSPLPILVCIVIGLIVGISLPYFYIIYRRKKRMRRFDEQLPDALDYIARSLRAGNPFSAALKSVSVEMADPIGTAFGQTFDEMNYGLELEDALYNLGDRVGSEEVQYFITAVLVQRTTGGNLAEVLNRIASVMRERARTFREVIIQASEMRLSARILIALPFVVAGAVSIFNPGYLASLLDEPLGRIIIGIQIVLMVVGYLVIRRMINFRI